jgi:hypothetical protein
MDIRTSTDPDRSCATRSVPTRDLVEHAKQQGSERTDKQGHDGVLE